MDLAPDACKICRRHDSWWQENRTAVPELQFAAGIFREIRTYANFRETSCIGHGNLPSVKLKAYKEVETW